MRTDQHDVVPGNHPVREQLLHAPPHHAQHELAGRRVGRQARRDGAAVDEHRDAVADAADLVEPVRDVDHAHAVGGKTSHNAEENLDLLPVEDRGRLVHDQQPDVVRQGASDRDHLLGGRAQVPHVGVGRDVAVVEPLEQRGRLLAHQVAVQKTRAARLVPEEHALGDRQVPDQVELLVDRRDPAGQRL